jgi:hypothetical protein
LDKNSGIASKADGTGSLSDNSTQNSSSGRRFSALLLPIAGLYIGAVALVALGIFLLVQFGENKLTATPSRDIDLSAGPIVEGTPRTGNLAEEPPPARPNVTPELSVPASEPIIEEANASPELPPAAADPVPSPTLPAAKDISPEPDPDLVRSLAITIPPIPPNNRHQNPGDPASSVTSDTMPKVVNIDSALSSEAPPTVAEEPSVPAANEAVAANATPAKASADARSPVTDRVSRPSRPTARIISLEPTTRLVIAPPAPTSGPLPGAGDGPSQIGPDMAATSAKADPALPTTNEALPAIATAPSVSPPDAAPAAKTTLASAPPEEARPPATDTAALMSRGDTLFELRDIVSARLFYERAANAGNAQAAIRLGETFDPSFLARAGLNGVRGDPAVAVLWYQRARELGSREADILLTHIEGKLER